MNRPPGSVEALPLRKSPKAGFSRCATPHRLCFLSGVHARQASRSHVRQRSARVLSPSGWFTSRCEERPGGCAAWGYGPSPPSVRRGTEGSYGFGFRVSTDPLRLSFKREVVVGGARVTSLGCSRFDPRAEQLHPLGAPNRPGCLQCGSLGAGCDDRPVLVLSADLELGGWDESDLCPRCAR
jgi:hypothetical protein